MRAVVVDRFGPPEVAVIRDIPVPRLRPHDVLVRVGAASVNSGDARIRAANFPPGFATVARIALGFRGPRRKVLGVAMAGTVETVGDAVTSWQSGDRVCAMLGTAMGGHAEYVRVPASKLVRIPGPVSLEAAAAVLFGGGTARHFLHRVAALRAGQRVLVNGAAGSLGSAAVQLARIAGAHVTGVTGARNRERVHALGADHTVDYADTPVAQLRDRFDLVLDAVGNLHPGDAGRLLTADGTMILAVASLGETITARGRVRAGVAAERPEDIAVLLAHLAAGELDPTIDQVLPLGNIADAYRRVDSGRKVGNVLVVPSTD